MAGPQQVDHNAIKFAQNTIILTVALGWVADLPWLIPTLAVVLAASTALTARGPLRLAYRYVILPLRIVRPHLVVDEAAPHRFSQGLGALFLAGSTVGLYAGAPGWGWMLAGLVALLAAVNVVWNLCVGCVLFYQLRRAGLIRWEQTA